jgi:hypothetical protein
VISGGHATGLLGIRDLTIMLHGTYARTCFIGFRLPASDMASSFKGNYAGARVSLLNCWSFGVDIIRRIVEQHTAFSDERTERCQHLLTAESAGAATDSGREERANLDGDYDNDHDRGDYDEDRNADRCRRGLT